MLLMRRHHHDDQGALRPAGPDARLPPLQGSHGGDPRDTSIMGV
jgi:hypothetical protein